MKKTTKLQKLALTTLTLQRLTAERLKEVRGGRLPSVDLCNPTDYNTCTCHNC